MRYFWCTSLCELDPAPATRVLLVSIVAFTSRPTRGSVALHTVSVPDSVDLVPGGPSTERVSPLVVTLAARAACAERPPSAASVTPSARSTRRTAARRRERLIFAGVKRSASARLRDSAPETAVRASPGSAPTRGAQPVTVRRCPPARRE